MINKVYGLGVIVGRFQILHKGHSQMIGKALELCSEVGLFVGSSQESGTYKNPFSYEMRKELLSAAFPELKIFPLPDIGVGNTAKWGEYVMQNVIDRFGRKPDLFVSGREERRVAWFGEDVAELYVPKAIEISATQMKEFIIDNDRASWDEYIDPAIAGRYDELRKIILASKDVLETKSV